jgi:hypothetical protein
MRHQSAAAAIVNLAGGSNNLGIIRNASMCRLAYDSMAAKLA